MERFISEVQDIKQNYSQFNLNLDNISQMLILWHNMNIFIKNNNKDLDLQLNNIY